MRGQKYSFQKKQVDNPRTEHLQNKAHFGREILSSVVIIFNMSMFLLSAGFLKKWMYAFEWESKGAHLYLYMIPSVPLVATWTNAKN